MQQQKLSLVHYLYEKLASLRLTVFLFLILAVASVLGTLLPQGLGPEEIQARYRPLVVWWIDTLGLTDLYHTGWFRLLLILLCANLVVCTIERFPKTLKLLRHKEEQISAERLLKFSLHAQISSPLPLERVQTELSKRLREGFAAPQPVEARGGFGAIAEKGRWSRLMVYVVHLSVLIVLLGAIVGSIWGFKGFMNIPEGTASSDVALMRGHESVELPFEVRCDDFDVSFYDTGAPKEFRSDLTILENGQEVLKRSIRVNDPLTYRGITFYQSSYGAILKEAEVEFTERESGKVFKLTLPYRGEPKVIPGTSDKVQVVEFRQDISKFGPAVGIVLAREGEESSGSWILVNVPEFHGNRVKNYQVRVLRAEQAQYTGLQVKRDPGVWFVWVGFVAMLIGMGITYYSSHRKLWIWAAPALGGKGAGTVSVVVAGRANKNSLAFEREFNDFCDRLKEGLGSGKEKKSEDKRK